MKSFSLEGVLSKKVITEGKIAKVNTKANKVEFFKGLPMVTFNCFIADGKLCNTGVVSKCICTNRSRCHMRSRKNSWDSNIWH